MLVKSEVDPFLPLLAAFGWQPCQVLAYLGYWTLIILFMLRGLVEQPMANI